MEEVAGNVRIFVNLNKIRNPQLEYGEEATAFDAGDTEVSSSIKQTADNINLTVKNEFKSAGLDITYDKVQLLGGLVEFMGGTQNNHKFIEVRLDANNIPHFIFFDANDNEVYDLGYTGLRQLVNNGTPDQYSPVLLEAYLSGGSAVAGEDGDFVNGKALYGDTYTGYLNPMTDLPAYFFVEGFTIGTGGTRIYNWGGDYADGGYLEDDNPTQSEPGAFLEEGWYFIYEGMTEVRYKQFSLIKVDDEGIVTNKVSATCYKFLNDGTDKAFSDKPNGFTTGYRCSVGSSVGYWNSNGTYFGSGSEMPTIPVTS